MVFFSFWGTSRLIFESFHKNSISLRSKHFRNVVQNGQSTYISIMACTNCSTGAKDGTPKGCNNNGTCGTDSCNKLSVFDWLSNMTLPGGQEPFDAAEIRFKTVEKNFSEIQKS